MIVNKKKRIKKCKKFENAVLEYMGYLRDWSAVEHGELSEVETMRLVKVIGRITKYLTGHNIRKYPCTARGNGVKSDAAYLDAIQLGCDWFNIAARALNDLGVNRIDYMFFIRYVSGELSHDIYEKFGGRHFARCSLYEVPDSCKAPAPTGPALELDSEDLEKDMKTEMGEHM